MKKILYITTVSRTINAFLIPHIEMLLSKGYTVDCACNIDRPIDISLQQKGVLVYNLPFSRNPLSIKNIFAFNKLMLIQKINNYDIIHVHTPVASFFGRLLKVRFHKIKVIYTAHGYHFYEGAPKKLWRFFYPIENLLARLTDEIITINKEDYYITKNNLRPKECCLINGVGIDLDKYKEPSEEEREKIRGSLNLSKEDFVILMVAEVNENKNHIQLIEAMNILKERYPRIKALCVGEGNKLEEMKLLMKQKNLHNNIEFLGYREDIKSLISASDLGILLSYREGLPRSVMEFMAMGRKVVGTDIRGIRDLIKNEAVGTLVQVGDFEATAEAIEKYYIIHDRKFVVPKDIESYEVNAVINELSKVYKTMGNK